MGNLDTDRMTDCAKSAARAGQADCADCAVCADEIFIEAEHFSNKGGWTVDQQSYETLGSAYLMAHGLGVPVSDASTKFGILRAGRYSVWVYTRDWTAIWNASSHEGRFCVKIDGARVGEDLGTNGEKWAWQHAGSVYLSAGAHEISLCDLTGFNARCDCVYLCAEGVSPSEKYGGVAAMREKFSKKPVRAGEEYDLIVVGGGVAGICLAYAALRSGVKTLLLNDRPILGGCNSSEIRVCMGGMRNLPPYPEIGNAVRAIEPICGSPQKFEAKYYEDERKALIFEEIGARNAVKTGERLTGATVRGGKIEEVLCENIFTGEKTIYRAKLFADCSGDAILARLAGAETAYGREAESEYGETLAPKNAQKLVMGHSIRWYAEETEEESAFPDLDWGFDFDENSYFNCTSGDWEQETGFTRDMVNEIEYIRDYGLRAIFSNWSYQKNHCREKEKFAKYKLKWASALGGKRESYRVKGDVFLTQNDIENFVEYPDGTACLTWSIDMHFPEPANAEKFGEAFRSCAYHRGFGNPYPVPYRCLYSKDVPNLFLGGRIVSMSHVAFSSGRVMRTLGQLGEAAGIASGVCVRRKCTPREVYGKHLEEYRELLKKGISVPAAFDGGTGSNEAFHFKDLGWLTFDKEGDRSHDVFERPECEKEYRSRIEKFDLPLKYGK